MRRAPFVLSGTLAGVVGVMMFHSSPVPPALAVGPGASSGSSTTTTSQGGATTTSAPPPTTTTTTPARRTTNASTATTSTTTTAPSPTTTVAPTTTTTVTSATRSATGPLVNYYYGELSVSVHVSGTKITSVTIATLSDGGNFRSQSIDQYSIPLLEQQAMAVQSARIQGVSGASYTSAGFAQSLQGALSSLGIK